MRHHATIGAPLLMRCTQIAWVSRTPQRAALGEPPFAVA